MNEKVVHYLCNDILFPAMNFDSQFFEWIETHKNEDPNKLRLRYHSGLSIDGIDYNIAIGHIETIKRGGQKLKKLEESGLMPEVLFPPFALEQSSSSDTSIFHNSLIDKYLKKQKQIKILDMTCGLGIDSQVFARAGYEVVSLEMNSIQAEIAKFNYRSLHNLTIINQDCIEFINNTDEHFDVIFIDPARRDSAGKRIYGIKDCLPNLIELLPSLRKHTELLIAKLSPMLDIKQTLRDLQSVEALHVVGSHGECKELVAIVNFYAGNNYDIEDVPITVNSRVGKEAITFTLKQEKDEAQKQCFMTPNVGDSLYVPDSCIMKAGCFATITDVFDIFQISKDSHLYSGEKGIKGFPGKEYEIIEIVAWNRENSRILAKKWPNAKVTSRNFPITSEELKRRLKLKESDRYHLFVTTDSDDKKLMIMTKRD